MMPRQIGDTLANIGEQAERRLDKLKEYYPTPKQPPMTFDEYLPRALARAQHDEKFARELAHSLYVTARMGG